MKMLSMVMVMHISMILVNLHLISARKPLTELQPPSPATCHL